MSFFALYVLITSWSGRIFVLGKGVGWLHLSVVSLRLYGALKERLVWEPGLICFDWAWNFMGSFSGDGRIV